MNILHRSPTHPRKRKRGPLTIRYFTLRVNIKAGYSSPSPPIKLPFPPFPHLSKFPPPPGFRPSFLSFRCILLPISTPANPLILHSVHLLSPNPTNLHPSILMASPSTPPCPLTPPSPTTLAQTMGFASFGAKPHLKKKRKLDGLGGGSGSGSGSNSLPLGAGVRRGIESGESGEDGGEDGEGDGMVANDVPEITRAVVASPQELYATNTNTATNRLLARPPQHQNPASYLHALGQPSQHPHQHQHQKQQQHASRADKSKSFRDENGDMAYYDRSFVEDPWRGLELGEKEA